MTNNNDVKTSVRECPFCGSEKLGIISSYCEPMERDAYAIKCNTNGCHGEIWHLAFGQFETEEQAIAAWNTRASLASRPAVQITEEMKRAGAAQMWEEYRTGLCGYEQAERVFNAMIFATTKGTTHADI